MPLVLRGTAPCDLVYSCVFLMGADKRTLGPSASELSPRMPSSRDGAYGFAYTLYCISVCSTRHTTTASAIVSDCSVPFPVAQCFLPIALNFLRLLWQSFLISRCLFRLLGFFSIARQLFPIAQYLFSDCSVVFFRLLQQANPFAEQIIFYAGTPRSNYTVPSQNHTF